MALNPWHGYYHFYKGSSPPESIGDTQSGKQVLIGGPESYSQGFNEQDHLDAKKMHEDKAAMYEKRTQSHMLKPGQKFDHRAIAAAQDQAAKHRDIAEWHEQQSPGEDQESKDIKAAQRAQEEEGMEKSKGEGSRGGKVIGHTKSGKPVYESSHKGSSSLGWNLQDHKDAVQIHKNAAFELLKQGKGSNDPKYKKHISAANHHKELIEMSGGNTEISKNMAKIKWFDKDSREGVVESKGKKYDIKLPLHGEMAKDYDEVVNNISEGSHVEFEPDESLEEQGMLRIKKAFKQKLSGGLADAKQPSDFDSKALEEGIKVELEHTNDKNIAKEIAMDHLTEDPNYYKKLKTIEKSLFMNYGLLYKGGPGSGKRGHTTAQNPNQPFKPRKPWPGEEAHNLPEMQNKEHTYTPPGGIMPHYTDDQAPELAKYKKLLRLMNKHGMDYNGHITFDPQTRQIKLLTRTGKSHIDNLKNHYASSLGEAKEK